MLQESFFPPSFRFWGGGFFDPRHILQVILLGQWLNFFFSDYIFSRFFFVQTFISRSIGLSEYGSHLTIELMSLSRTTPGDVAWMMRRESFVANSWGGFQSHKETTWRMLSMSLSLLCLPRSIYLF